MIFKQPISSADKKLFQLKALYWSNQYSAFCLLDNNNYRQLPHRSEWILAASQTCITAKPQLSLSHFAQTHKGQWLFGHVGYDYRVQLFEKLHARLPAFIPFEDWSFFIPQVLIQIHANEVSIESEHDSPEKVWQEINQLDLPNPRSPGLESWQSSATEENYLKNIDALQEHILEGDCYEINYCVEQRSRATHFDPIRFFNLYNDSYPAPFAACYKTDHTYVCSGSPERFLCGTRHSVLAQPMKGTAARCSNLQADKKAKHDLQNSIKEKAEHVMIVDLMRNDLARCCQVGTIKVEDLYGIYSFPHVHQMISTISGLLKEEMSWGAVLENCFPMGSMTGAPKLKVMELIDQFETFPRGLFSGSVGYITPEGDFDFNVLIRTLFFDSLTQRLSYATGGAITIGSNAVEEYAEMQLKARGMQQVLASM